MTTTLFSNLPGDLTGKPGRRPPLVLLHGLTFDRTSWRPVLAKLATLDPGRRVLALDLPGHGESPPWLGYDLEPIADAIHQSVAEAGLSSPVLAGHSVSGVIATIYAARYPKSVSPLACGSSETRSDSVEPPRSCVPRRCVVGLG